MYNVYLKVTDDQDQKIDWHFSFKKSKKTYKTIETFFTLIMGEGLKDHYAENVSDTFENVIEVLFQNFDSKSLNRNGSLEEAINQHIRTLEKDVFYLPDGLVDEFKDKLIQEESGQYWCGLNTLAEIFKRSMKSLRDEKIQFWNKFLELYRKNQEAYDLEFRTKEKRHQDDLDRISRGEIPLE
ncbi:MAG: hypothetical protein ACTSR7_20385 [Promethearchaeota archaeon]